MYDEIKEAYKNNPAHSEVVRTSSVDRAMKKGKAAVLADASDNKYLHKIEDTIAELRDWGCFENEYNDEYDDYDDERGLFHRSVFRSADEKQSGLHFPNKTYTNRKRAENRPQ